MKKNILKIIVPLLFTGVLSSCATPLDFLMAEGVATDCLYVGGYPTAQLIDAQGEDTYLDYYLYVSFLTSDSNSYTSYHYDVCIDLNDSSNQILGSDGDSTARYVDLENSFTKLTKFSNYSSLGAFFNQGNYVSVFSSVGPYNSAAPFVSTRFKISHSGYVYSFSTISNNGDDLSASTIQITKKDFFWNFLED